jgi:hypothetical protein
LLGSSYGERTEEKGIDHAEDGGVRSNAEAQSQNSDRSEAKVLTQHAETEAYILIRGFNDADASSVSTVFLGLLKAAEFARGFAPCFFERQAGANDLTRLLFEVMLELIAQFPFDLIAAKEGAKTKLEYA